MMFDLMTRSDNEVIREMGRGLRDDDISLQGLGEIEAYREAISGGFDQLGQLDFGAMSEQLDEIIAEPEQQDAGNDQADDRNAFDEEDVYQGLWGEQGGFR